MSKLKIALYFGAPIGCLIVGLFFLWYYFFRFYPRHGNTEDLFYAIITFIAGAIWFKVLYKGYKLTKAEEQMLTAKETQKTVPAQQTQTAASPAARYWKRFTWVVVGLFVLGLIIRYFLGVYR